MTRNRHFFHLVDPSPWPVFLSLSLFLMTLGFIAWINYDLGYFVLFGFISLVFGFISWTRDVVREATFLGYHTTVVRRGLQFGIFLFLISEACFFLSFFWAFLHSSLSTAIQIGPFWPPLQLRPALIDAFGIPLLNTVLLVTSGTAVTWAQKSMLNKNFKEADLGFFVTFFTAVLFVLLQVIEYLESGYTWADGIYGSVFFIATGFHGLHVLVGTAYLFVHFCRYKLGHFTRKHMDGLHYAAWYWHFVDVVWLALFIIIYWWGNLYNQKQEAMQIANLLSSNYGVFITH